MNFTVGYRVQLHPGTDWWMSGARFGEITSIRKGIIRVRLDRTGTVVKLHPTEISECFAPI